MRTIIDGRRPLWARQGHVGRVSAGAFFLVALFLTGIGTPTSARATVTLTGFEVPNSGPNVAPIQTLGLSATPHSEPTPAIDAASDRVGTSAGDFSVTPSGAATYTFPLYAAPGVGGFVPKLALEYHSRSGGGPLGVGFSISGYSTITRCRRSSESGDGAGFQPPVVLDATDVYCLDGERLLPATNAFGAGFCPAGPSGSTTTEWRTERESFRRVCSYTATGIVGPAFFTIEGRDGSKSWYGNTADSFINPNTGTAVSTALTDRALLWAINRQQDAFGNAIDYAYTEDSANGEFHLNTVRYATNGALFNEIKFNYLANLPSAAIRTDYEAGSKLTLSQRLDSIDSTGYTSDAASTTGVLRRYRLTYTDPTTGNPAPHVTGIKECVPVSSSVDPSGELCLPPTTFAWTAPNQGVGSAASSGAFNNSHGNRVDYKLADINGDGRSDVVWVMDSCPTDPLTCDAYWSRLKFHISFGTADGLTAPVNTNIVLWPGRMNGEVQSIADTWLVYDFDGDGHDDVLFGNVQTLDITTSTTSHQLWWELALATKNVSTGQWELGGNPGPLPSDDTDLITSSQHRVRFADFTGDGLPDLLYTPPDGTQMKVLPLARRADLPGTRYRLQTPAKSVVLTNLSGVAVTLQPSYRNWEVDDFNSDGYADLILREADSATAPPGGYVSLPEQDFNALPSVGGANLNSVTTVTTTYNDFFVTSHGINASDQLEFVTYARVLPVGAGTQPIAGKYALMADINGDGLTDAFYFSGGGYYYRLNRGAGAVDTVLAPPVLVSGLPTTSPGGFTIPDPNAGFGFQDLNGDGRADLIYRKPAGTNLYQLTVRYWTGNDFGADSPVIAGNPSLNTTALADVWIDHDGDGDADYLSVVGNKAATLTRYPSLVDQPLHPADVVETITNGLGAITQIGYYPATYSTVHARQAPSATTWQARDDWGRKAPVFDYFSPMPLVFRVATSQPQEGAPSAMHVTRYRYDSGTQQAGGRGFLGFQWMMRVDAATRLADITQYSPNFPFDGHAVDHHNKLLDAVDTVTGQDPLTDPCAALPTNADACFKEAPATIWVPSGQSLQYETFSLQSQPAFVATTQQPVYVYAQQTDSMSWALATPIWRQTAASTTAVTLDAYGNPISTVEIAKDEANATVQTATMAVAYCTAQKTAPTATCTDMVSATRWWLGRPVQRKETHDRPGASPTSRTRTTAYVVDSTTGQTIEEQREPAGSANLDLRTVWLPDGYGNLPQQYQCSNDYATRTACSTLASLAQQPGEATPTKLQRYTKAIYDALHRYVMSTQRPYYSATATNNVSLQTSEQIGGRNGYGDPTSVIDANGLTISFQYGYLGRKQFASSATGSFSNTVYRWCGTVTCPPNAVYRVEQHSRPQAGGAQIAPTTWTYFDVLNREVLRTTQGFQRPTDAAVYDSVRTTYDGQGRTATVSEPYRSKGPSNANPELPNVGTVAGLVETGKFYDVLDRVTAVTLPNGGVTSTTYDADDSVSSTVDVRKTVVTNARNYARTEWRNPLGEVTRVKDAKDQYASYTYEPFGNVGQVVLEGTTATTVTTGFDTWGRKTSLTDPDKGTWSWTYNAAGEAITQTDAKNQVARSYYDALGRRWKRTEQRGGSTEAIVTWQYDTAVLGASTTPALGVLALESDSISGYSRSFTYDALGRGAGSQTNLDSGSYTTSTGYDSYGRTDTNVDASTGGVLQTFTNVGQPWQWQDAANAATTYREVTAQDAWGHVTAETLGNTASLALTRGYDGAGRLIDATAGTLQHFGFTYDYSNSVKTRTDYIGTTVEETFILDELDRLYDVAITKLGANTYPDTNVVASTRYDTLGNVTSKTGTGSYSYRTTPSGCTIAGPHAVSQVGSTTYCYDANGNQTQANTSANVYRTLAYTGFDLPHTIRRVDTSQSLDETETLSYAPDRSRWKRVESHSVTNVDPSCATFIADRLFCSGFQPAGTSTATTTTSTVGNVEFITRNGSPETKRYIGDFLVITTKGATTTTEYLLRDHLGSVDQVVPVVGGVVQTAQIQKLRFDAFGQRRNLAPAAYNSWTNLTTAQAAFFDTTHTTRGYTGHEQMDPVGLVHMNGRVYDPNLGRFLQADPLIQDGTDTQAFNRYSYVGNRPLSATDPTGLAMELNDDDSEMTRRQKHDDEQRKREAKQRTVFDGYYHAADGTGTIKGATTGQSATSTTAPSQDGGFWSTVADKGKRVIAGNWMEVGERGEVGTFGDKLSGGAREVGNILIGLANLGLIANNPVGVAYGTQPLIPTFSLSNKQVLGAAWVDTATVLAGPLSRVGRFSALARQPLSAINYLEDLSSIPKAAPGENVVILGQYWHTGADGVTRYFAGALDTIARRLGGRTLADIRDLTKLAPEIQSADRLIFFTSSRMGSGVTAREMQMIQSNPLLREKTTFIPDLYPK